MLFGKKSKEKQDLPVSLSELVQPMVRNDDKADIPQQSDLQRQMYERIAAGNALAEAEDNARHQWRGK